MHVTMMTGHWFDCCLSQQKSPTVEIFRHIFSRNNHSYFMKNELSNRSCYKASDFVPESYSYLVLVNGKLSLDREKIVALTTWKWPTEKFVSTTSSHVGFKTFYWTENHWLPLPQGFWSHNWHNHYCLFEKSSRQLIHKNQLYF